MSGRVQDAASGTNIAGAIVAVHLSVPRAFQATTGADGSYSLMVPALYGCLVEGLEVSAPGYQTESLAVTFAALQAEPIRNFALSRVNGM